MRIRSAYFSGYPRSKASRRLSNFESGAENPSFRPRGSADVAARPRISNRSAGNRMTLALELSGDASRLDSLIEGCQAGREEIPEPGVRQGIFCESSNRAQ